MYKNRIVDYGHESPDQLLANPANYRIHPKMQQELLHSVLSDVGIVQNVIVNKITNRVVDGHLRVALAIRNGEQSIPVTYVELSEEEERIILATFDPSANYAVNDAELYQDLLKDIDTTNEFLQNLFAQELVDMKAEDPLADDVDSVESPEQEQKYLIQVELTTIDEYDELLTELKHRNYIVKGNQKWQ
jgi:ParB-like chromosome segregation protein Spo0J